MLVEWFEVKNNIYACLEIGSSEARILVCNIRQERLYVLSQQEILAEGIENGNVINVNQIVEILKNLKEKVEKDLHQEIQSVLLAIPSVDVNIENITTTLSVEANKPISPANVKQLFRNVINQPTYRDQVVVNIIPRSFIVDEKNAIQNPLGIIGNQVSLSAQKMTASSSLVYNLINVVELAGFRISDIVLGSVAEMMYVATPEQLYKGVCHVNIGKSTTTITVSQGGKVLSSVSLSIGGEHVTEEISEAFQIEKSEAELLKVNFARINYDDMIPEIIYTAEGNGEFICITRQMLSDVVTSRYEDILKLVKQYLTENGYKHEDIKYIFTGGAVELEGLNILGKFVFAQDIHIFRPSMLGVRKAKYAKLVGMATFNHEIALLTSQKSNIINFDAYSDARGINLMHESRQETEKKVSVKTNNQDKSYMDHKLENSGVLVRLFDMIFDEKAE